MQSALSGVPQGSVLGPLLFILYTADLGDNLENKIVSFADDTTLFAKINTPVYRNMVANSLNSDLTKIQLWCELWGMKLNPSKTHSMIVSRSRTDYPPHPPLHLCGTTLEVSNSLKLLGVTLDSKLTFEKHIRNMASSISQKTGILRKGCKTLGRNDAVIKSFYAFILPCFEYCMPVWSSAVNSHLRLLDRALNNIRFIVPDVSSDLEKRRKISCLSFLYKVFHNPSHPLHAYLPAPYVRVRQTRYALAMNDHAFSDFVANTNQFSRSFFPYYCKLWNVLPNDVVHCVDLNCFKIALKKHCFIMDLYLLEFKFKFCFWFV